MLPAQQQPATSRLAEPRGTALPPRVLAAGASLFLIPPGAPQKYVHRAKLLKGARSDQLPCNAKGAVLGRFLSVAVELSTAGGGSAVSASPPKGWRRPGS